MYLTIALVFGKIVRMLKIRLQRTGRVHEPTFRVVVTDSKNSTKSGRVKEVLGSYDPRVNKVVLDADRIKYWMSVGALASGTVHNLLVTNKIVSGKKINVLPQKTVVKKEEPATEAKPASTETPKAEDKVADAPAQ